MRGLIYCPILFPCLVLYNVDLIFNLSEIRNFKFSDQVREISLSGSEYCQVQIPLCTLITKENQDASLISASDYVNDGGLQNRGARSCNKGFLFPCLPPFKYLRRDNLDCKSVISR